MTDRDKAENLWQMLNGVYLLLKNNKIDVMKEYTIENIQNTLLENRINSEETQIDQDKQFAKLVFNELPLSSDIPLVNRLITMCKERLNIID